ncbi:MAG: hypothetical protein AB7T31_06525 [Gemmatimonadales bacterium]
MTTASPALRVLAVLMAGTALAGCASTGPTPPRPATDAEWRALATPRPDPVPGAARLSLASIDLVGQPAWAIPASGVTPAFALSELVVAGLLRRGDVRFVERRRFAAAVAAEDAGIPRPPTAPPVGVSEGAELLASVVWIPLPNGDASLEVRLVQAATGVVAGTGRTTIPAGADLVSTARMTVGSILSTLGDVGRRPAWSDPVAGSAPTQLVPANVSAGALGRFLEGLTAEESWRWEPARIAYQAAASSAGFFEAEAALARAARLRLGGTLGAS